MTNYTIVLFLCNWGPYAGYQDLQQNGFQVPAEIKMVRIPCTGRISRALLFKAFEMGADGVAVVGCTPGTCRHGAGSTAAQDSLEDTKNIVDLLGLARERLRLVTFLPDESKALKRFLISFCRKVKSLGKSPVQATSERAERPAPGGWSIAEIVKEHDVYSCQDCGKCTSSCPLALSGKIFSPRAIAGAAIQGNVDSGWVLKDIQSCLTCGTCHERCPSDVNFPDFIRDLRQYIHEHKGACSGQPHGGFFQSLMRAMASPDLTPERWADIPDDIRLDSKGKTLFFGGCAPYFDAFFHRHQSVKSTEILSGALRLLNFFGVDPRVSASERCCGHDLLWSGDKANFLRLARLNVEIIRDLGVEEVITSCPECYRTLAFDYETHGVSTGFRVTHLYEFLETEIGKNGVAFHPLGKKITYQDSCRLNRLDDLRALPRKLIYRLTHTDFSEMKDAERAALCCGNCAWTGCDASSKALQIKRLRQARDTGSGLIATSCPKCRIHLGCAMEDPLSGEELFMETMDLTNIIEKTIYWK